MNAHLLLHDPNARRRIEDRIERLVSLLDRFDPDADLEPDLDAEPGTWTEFAGSRASCSIEDENLEHTGDFEPSLGAAENHPEPDGHGRSADGAQADWRAANHAIGDDEPALAAPEAYSPDRSQTTWADGYSLAVDREDENEHGGDIKDEPQDGDADREPFLGWTEQLSIEGGSSLSTGHDVDSGEDGGSFAFEGDGYLAARTVLRNLWCRRPDRPQEYPRISAGIGNRAALTVDGLTIKGKRSISPKPIEPELHVPSIAVSRAFAPKEMLDGMGPTDDWRAMHYRAARQCPPAVDAKSRKGDGK